MRSRRQFIRLLPAGAAALLATQAEAQLPRLSEQDPQAQALGYGEDAARVDRRRYPKYAPGQDCAGCDLYTRPAEAWAVCTLFPRRVVAGKGWCDAFTTRRRNR